ncbi:MAG: hypothetical protein MI861_21410 [Pirellulales bacterium]|nr:hypothetical protein [Pirellulales bacterium]
MVSAVVQNDLLREGEISQQRVRISVFSRFDERISLPKNYDRPPLAVQSGVVKLRKQFRLRYQPTLIRVSDTHVALVGRYGTNRPWLEQKPAIRILALAGEEIVSVPFEKLVPDISTCAHVSDSSITWCRDAWFSNDGSKLYLALWQAKDHRSTAPLLAIDAKTGAAQPVEESEIKAVMEQSELRFHPTLFDVARARELGELRQPAQKMWQDPTQSLNVRVHAAAYSFAVFQDEQAMSVVRSIAEMYDESNVLRPGIPVEAALRATHYEDPIEFALNNVRQAEKPKKE